jgi:hypothetical protein
LDGRFGCRLDTLAQKHSDRTFADGNDFCGELAATAVEQGNLMPHSRSQNATQVLCAGAVNIDLPPRCEALVNK